MSTATIPQIRVSSPLDAILQDPRLDWLAEQVSVRWATDNEHLAGERKSESFKTQSSSDQIARSYLRYAAALHCRRALKALRSGKIMPVKPTNTQWADGLREEDLPDLNAKIREMISQHILLLAESMNTCAVMFSDPAKVAELLDL